MRASFSLVRAPVTLVRAFVSLVRAGIPLKRACIALMGAFVSLVRPSIPLVRACIALIRARIPLVGARFPRMTASKPRMVSRNRSSYAGIHEKEEILARMVPPISDDAPSVREILSRWQSGGGRLVFLTGAGVSAESGIPTFRGAGGYWRAGSKNYTPQELATRAMFEEEPKTVWEWYLSRLAACRGAQPNLAHRAIAALQRHYGDRVALVTQNVDGLHLRAGSPVASTYEIHGNIAYVRCSRRCVGDLSPLPDGVLPAPGGGPPITPPLRDLLTCHRCQAWLRPHVLWFDEYYEEEHFRARSAYAAAVGASVLVVVGTTGATNLPMQIGHDCERAGIPIVDVNIERTVFSDLARPRGAVVRQPAATAIPELAALLGVAIETSD